MSKNCSNIGRFAVTYNCTLAVKKQEYGILCKII
jgi:hypothetical protein